MCLICRSGSEGIVERVRMRGCGRDREFLSCVPVAVIMIISPNFLSFENGHAGHDGGVSLVGFY
jgi:hypothetical protein